MFKQFNCNSNKNDQIDNINVQFHCVLVMLFLKIKNKENAIHFMKG